MQRAKQRYKDPRLCVSIPATTATVVPHHASRVISKTHAGSVHHPIVRVTQAALSKASGLLPGCGHITKHNIDHPQLLRLCADLHFDCVCRLGIILETKILGLEWFRCCSVQVVFRDSLILGREEFLFLGTALLRIFEEALYFFADRGREEVSLDGGDSFWRLGGDDVDTDDSAIG